MSSALCYPLVPTVRRAGLLAALAVLAAGCQDADAPDATTSGTYRAVFVSTEGGVRDTLAVVEGELAPPVAAGDVVSVALPAHSGRIRVSNTQWPLPYGLEASTFLLSYRTPGGDLAIYSSDFSTPRFCDVDTANADVRAIAVAPMWASEAAGHPLSVFDGAEPYDSLASFTVARPSGDANTTPLDAAAAAGRQSVSVYVETRWADGREHPVVLAFRGVSDGSWWASALDRDPRAVPAEGVQHYEGSFALNAERPEAFLVALSE